MTSGRPLRNNLSQTLDDDVLLAGVQGVSVEGHCVVIDGVCPDSRVALVQFIEYVLGSHVGSGVHFHVERCAPDSTVFNRRP